MAIVTRRATFWLTLVFCAAAVVSSLGGVFFERTLYSADTPYWTAQVWGQDLVTLVLLLPVLAASAVGLRRGYAAAMPVWFGLALFLFYVYACYGFTLHFNRMFAVHCAAFGMTVYMLVLAMRGADAEGARDWFGVRTPVWPAVAYLGVVGVAMTAFWLVQLIPATLAARLPDYAVLDGYSTSPIHLLDLGIFFPGFIATAVLLSRRAVIAYVLAPALIVYSVVMTFCLIEQAAVLSSRGFDGGLEFTPVFGGVLAAGLAVLVWGYRIRSRAGK